MAKRTRKMAIELLSDIGKAGYELQHYTDAEIAEAVKFMRAVNGPLFDYIVKVLSVAAPALSPEEAR